MADYFKNVFSIIKSLSELSLIDELERMSLKEKFLHEDPPQITEVSVESLTASILYRVQ